jgi:DNA-binding transcriptional LysR family regulator
MELRHLRYFVVLAEELNFTRAAARLHIGQPPLSMQIRDLERELGVALFERSRRHVALTAAGTAFLARAQRLLADAATAADEARRTGRGETGVLRIGFTSSLPYTSTLSDVLFRYRQRFPEVELQLAEQFTREQLEALARDELDVGLVRYVGGPLPDGIRVEEIGRDPLRLVINTAHPLAERAAIDFAELREQPFITFPRGVGTGLPALLAQLCQRAGFAPRIVQTAREATTQIGLVAAGLGLALLPAPLECVCLPRVRYLPLADDDVHFSLSVASRAASPSPLVRGFLDVLAEAGGYHYG